MGKASQRFAMVRRAAAKAAHGGKEGLSKHGNELLEVSGAIGLMLADKNLGADTLKVHPSTISIGAGLGLMLVTKGKTRRLGKTAIKAGILAAGARAVYEGVDSLADLAGPVARKKTKVAGPEAEEKKVHVHVNNDFGPLVDLLRKQTAKAEADAEVLEAS